MNGKRIPDTWVVTRLDDLVLINPPVDRQGVIDNTPVSFVPMAAVEEETGRLDASAARQYGDLRRKSYRYFEEGDVIFAKITPCMENGKMALAQALHGGRAFGSTEFHVLRPLEGIDGRYILHYIMQKSFRNEARSHMAGTAGQLRVPAKFLESVGIPLPPTPEQRRIVAAIEEQFSRIDAGVEALQRARRNLKRMRAAILRAAVTGQLVPHKPDEEPAQLLLSRIREERPTLWESQAGRGRGRRKYEEPVVPTTEEMRPDLPPNWSWVSWEQVGFSQNGRAFPSSQYTAEGVRLLRPGNLHASGRVVWAPENTRRLPEDWAAEFAEFLVGPNELVMNLTAQSLKDEFLGRVCLTGPVDEQCLLNQRIARLTPVLISRRYLLWMFKSPGFRRFVNGLNTGSLIQHMFTSQLDQFMFPLPPLPEQERIAEEIDRQFSIVENVARVIEMALGRADSLRSMVLRHAFQGALVPHDPSDEPASVLLDRLKLDRAAHSFSPLRLRTRSHQ